MHTLLFHLQMLLLFSPLARQLKKLQILVFSVQHQHLAVH